MIVETIDANGKNALKITLEDGEEALIISDTHFGLKVGGEYATDYQSLVKLMEHIKREHNVKLVVLLGDIFDFWQGEALDLMNTSYEFVKELMKLDATIVYVAGNHDRIIAKIVLRSRKGDIYVVPDFFILESGGRRFLLIHGHQFDRLFIATKGLWKIQSYVYTISEALLALPGPLEWGIAILSALSTATLIYITPPLPHPLDLALYYASAILVLPLIILIWRTLQSKFWYLLVKPLSASILKGKTRGKTLEQLIKKKSFIKYIKFYKYMIGPLSGVIFGHTHIPGVIKWNNLLIANSGSWIHEKGVICNTFIRVSNGEVKLYQWRQKEAKIIAIS
ncbi:MAG: hypothetical protein DRJ52_05200 [Thermoprotei archaeon]|nr:MAG: hypothetical protein DRJ52_05200 [Thermoprotei archaeon]RLF00083.1 MAG: hypothetical protein DRJ63_03575 [Thermoprotei archaeon]